MPEICFKDNTSPRVIHVRHQSPLLNKPQICIGATARHRAPQLVVFLGSHCFYFAGKGEYGHCSSWSDSSLGLHGSQLKQQPRDNQVLDSSDWSSHKVIEAFRDSSLGIISFEVSLIPSFRRKPSASKGCAKQTNTCLSLAWSSLGWCKVSQGRMSNGSTQECPLGCPPH